MGIVSSSFVKNGFQIDGRFWVAESHIDNIGLVYVIRYLSQADADTASILAARAITLAAEIVAAEIIANVQAVLTQGSLATPTFVYATQAANLAALRAAYLTATQEQAVMVGDFLSSLTNGQLQTIFGMTAGQVTTLRTNKLTPAATTAAAIRAAAGQ